ncbi:hypothetical protein B0T18DRAFT_364327 [Schizothecium vesticola]|uniref:DH domain-containing protein n=1 Tax=Schizothecium vesticola TaxID=314040 RepID=A0AA40F0Z0_9PEZI|nr:hypothetical protein B0T18DRAFT_364327 [Schizothecium vesticola]
MDPLSVIASVAGIITAASQAIKILGPYVTATKDAPKIASQVLSEVLAVKTIVAALEQLVATLASNTGPSRVQYASLVQVDQLLAVLTDGVLVFSELDALLQTLAPAEVGGSRARLLSSMQWVRKKGALATLCTRLQAFKLSINCILSILQSDSQVRAEDHQKQLLLSMDTLLKNNEALAQIFLGPHVAHAPVTWSRRISIQNLSPEQGPSEMSGRNRRSLFDLSFEKDLIASRVYRRIRRDTMDFSMRSSVARSNGWSIFSGMSLSDISEISVLALPIIPSDITNPQHYVEGPESRRAGELSLLPVNVYGSSIFHECVELEAQLVQLTQCLFKQILERERSSDILATLVSVFRRGAPLLQLYNQLDDSYQDRWKPLLSQEPSPSSAKLAVVEFIQACVMRQNIKTYDCFTVTDLMDDDTTNHVKVIRLVRQITSKLVDARKIENVDVDSLPQMHTPEGPPSPQMLAIEELVREERVYVVRLECLTQIRDQGQILGSYGMVLVGDLDAANDLLSRSRKLIDAQLRFLIQLESLALRPYKLFDLPWLQLFRNWANMSKDLYARFASGEKHAKRALQAAIALKVRSPTTGGSHELSTLVGDAIGSLSMPPQRLQKYRGFLEELAQYDDTMFVKEALDVVDEVGEKARAATDDVVRDDAKAALLSSLDAADQSSVLQYGKLLLFEDAASIDSNIDGEKNDRLARLYLFEKAVLQVSLAKRRGGLGRGEDGRIRLSIVRIIRGENLRLISNRGPKSRWLEDDDVPGGGFGIHFSSGKLIVHLPVESRHDKWVGALIQVRDECQKTTRSLAVQHYKLAVVGGMWSDRERFTHQFLVPHSPEEYQSDEWNPLNLDIDSRELVVANHTYNLEILGPPAQEPYSAMRYAYMATSDGFLLIYSVADRNSFEEILMLQQQILRTKDKDWFPMIVVGNNSGSGRAREVSAEEGRALANRMGCPFLEADAVTGYHVEKAFRTLAQEVNKYRMSFYIG